MALDRIEAKEIRGRVLKTLNINYPGDVSDRVLMHVLVDVGMSISPSVLLGHLAYLQDKGYLEQKEVTSKEIRVTLTLARLTAKGKDLLEGNIATDPGVRV